MAKQKLTGWSTKVENGGATAAGRVSAAELNELKTKFDNNADELDLKTDKVDGRLPASQLPLIIPVDNLPALHLIGGTGLGTEESPYDVGGSGGGFSQEDFIAWYQSWPGWAPDKIPRGDRTFIELVDNSLEKLATPVLSFGTATGDSIPVNWTAVANGTTYTLERASSITYADAVVIYSGPLFTFLDIGRSPVTQYFYRVRATANNFNGSNYATGNKTTDVAGNVTPVAPTMTGDDTADTLIVAHARGTAEIVVNINNAADVALTAVPGWNSTTNRIDVGNVARAAGYYRARTKAATGFNASPYVSSPAFNVALITPSAPITPITDNSARTYGWTNTGGKTNADTEMTLNGGTAVNANSANPINVGTDAKAPGQVGIRYKAVAGVSNASAWLFNTVAFTQVAPSYTPVTLWRALNGATLTGNSLSYTGSGVAQPISQWKVGPSATFIIQFEGTPLADGGAIGIGEGIDTLGFNSSLGNMAWKRQTNTAGRFQGQVNFGHGKYPNHASFVGTPLGRIRGDGTNIFFEYSLNNGTTWLNMSADEPVLQPAADLYIHGYFDVQNTAVPNITQTGMVAA